MACFFICLQCLGEKLEIESALSQAGHNQIHEGQVWYFINVRCGGSPRLVEGHTDIIRPEGLIAAIRYPRARRH